MAGGSRLHLYESAAQAGEDSDVTVDATDAHPPWRFAARGESAPAERSGYRQATLQAMLVAAIS